MDTKQSILVIGAGAIGLTTAYKLSRQGHRVTLLSEDYAGSRTSSKITSQVAAGIWQVPLHIYSQWRGVKDVENRIKTWVWQSYREFSELAMNSKTTGVYLWEYCYVYKNKIQDMPKVKAFMELYKNLPGFCHSRELLKEKCTGAGLVDCFTYQGPVVDTDVFLNWLKEKCTSLGVIFCQGSVRGFLRDRCASLKMKYNVDLIVNCAGLGARELAEDNDVYPLYGAGLIFKNPCAVARLPNNVINCTTHWHDDVNGTSGHVIVTPKGDDNIWIGSLKAPHDVLEWSVDHPAVQRMLNECISTYPRLQDMVAGQEMVLKVGARPMRKGSPRVEQDRICRSIIHNYGHCSLGIMLCLGCAQDVLNIVTRTVNSKL